MPRRLRPIRAWQMPATPAVPQGQAAVLEATLDHALVRSLGALPVLLPLCEQLGWSAIITRHCYPERGGPEAIDVGRTALVLILNRLQAPHPLVHGESWLAETVLPELLELDAAQCNDDRLARTLDAQRGTAGPGCGARWPLCARDECPGPGCGPDAGTRQATRRAREWSWTSRR